MNEPSLLSRATRAGDLVIVDDGDKLTPVYLKAGASLNNHLGCFRHDALIGRPFGHRALPLDRSGPGGADCYANVLAPTPELWSLSLSHRTQILCARRRTPEPPRELAARPPDRAFRRPPPAPPFRPVAP